MYFDGVRTGVAFIMPKGSVLLYSFTLTKRCSNNVVEYQALILSLELVVDMKGLHLRVYEDSQLIINQLLGEYDVK
jgi:ribonuclease HI